MFCSWEALGIFISLLNELNNFKAQCFILWNKYFSVHHGKSELNHVLTIFLYLAAFLYQFCVKSWTESCIRFPNTTGTQLVSYPFLVAIHQEKLNVLCMCCIGLFKTLKLYIGSTIGAFCMVYVSVLCIYGGHNISSAKTVKTRCI